MDLGSRLRDLAHLDPERQFFLDLGSLEVALPSGLIHTEAS